jgi:hypothetical protein
MDNTTIHFEEGRQRYQSHRSLCQIYVESRLPVGATGTNIAVLPGLAIRGALARSFCLTWDFAVPFFYQLVLAIGKIRPIGSQWRHDTYSAVCQPKWCKVKLRTTLSPVSSRQRRTRGNKRIVTTNFSDSQRDTIVSLQSFPRAENIDCSYI